MGVELLIVAPNDLIPEKVEVVDLSAVEQLPEQQRKAVKEWATKMITVKEQELGSLSSQLSLHSEGIQESLFTRLSIGTTKATALSSIGQLPPGAVSALSKETTKRPIEKKPEERISNYTVHVSTVVKQKTEEKIKANKSAIYTLNKIVNSIK